MLFRVVILNKGISFLKEIGPVLRLLPVVPPVSSLVTKSSSPPTKTSTLILSRSLCVLLGPSNKLCKVPCLDELLNFILEYPTILLIVTIFVMVTTVFGLVGTEFRWDDRQELDRDLGVESLL